MTRTTPTAATTRVGWPPIAWMGSVSEPRPLPTRIATKVTAASSALPSGSRSLDINSGITESLTVPKKAEVQPSSPRVSNSSGVLARWTATTPITKMPKSATRAERAMRSLAKRSPRLPASGASNTNGRRKHNAAMVLMSDPAWSAARASPGWAVTAALAKITIAAMRKTLSSAAPAKALVRWAARPLLGFVMAAPVSAILVS